MNNYLVNVKESSKQANVGDIITICDIGIIQNEGILTHKRLCNIPPFWGFNTLFQIIYINDARTRFAVQILNFYDNRYEFVIPEFTFNIVLRNPTGIILEELIKYTGENGTIIGKIQEVRCFEGNSKMNPNGYIVDVIIVVDDDGRRMTIKDFSFEKISIVTPEEKNKEKNKKRLEVIDKQLDEIQVFQTSINDYHYFLKKYKLPEYEPDKKENILYIESIVKIKDETDIDGIINATEFTPKQPISKEKLYHSLNNMFKKNILLPFYKVGDKCYILEGNGKGEYEYLTITEIPKENDDTFLCRGENKKGVQEGITKGFMNLFPLLTDENCERLLKFTSDIINNLTEEKKHLIGVPMVKPLDSIQSSEEHSDEEKIITEFITSDLHVSDKVMKIRKYFENKNNNQK